MKQHYLALDGLRGVAAITVVAHHVQNAAGVHDGLFRAGYLSVDFFFALSGFVIAAAYETKFAAGMGLRAFVAVRFRRLYPMMALGALVGVSVLLATGSSIPVGLALVSQLTLIPLLAGGGVLFAANAAYWSLLSETAANAAHVLLFRWASTRLLAFAVLLSGLGVLFVAQRFGHLGGGWGASNWWSAVPRVCFSYGAGVLIYRLHATGRLPRANAPLPVLATVFLGCIFLAGGAHHWLADSLVALVASPAILVAGVSTKPLVSGAAAATLGSASYPLYAVHSPLVAYWGQTNPQPTVWGGVVLVVALIAVAVALDRFVDRPVRTILAPKRAMAPPLTPAAL